MISDETKTKLHRQSNKKRPKLTQQIKFQSITKGDKNSVMVTDYKNLMLFEKDDS
jgi:hypothetical protein